MFQTLVQRLLNKILGQYIENFSAENLKIGIWSGEVILKNVVLKKDVIKKLNLPFKIRYSRLGCLKMNIPWKSLTSSKIEVVLEGFELVVEEVPEQLWECKNTKIIEKRKKQLQDYCEAVLNDFAKKGQKGKEGEDGYLSKLVVKIIDNLQVTVKDIHIRYQDEITKKYSFGVTLEELKLYTVNREGLPEYVDRNKPEYANEPLRKRLELYNIGIYWNEKTELYDEANFQQKMGKSIAKRGQLTYQHNYIILMSSQAKLQQRESGKQFIEPEIDLSINLETLRLEITNSQLQQIITLGERLQKYQREVKMQNRYKLTNQNVKKYTEQFLTLFPQFYAGWGKNMAAKSLERIEGMLEKMEIDNFTPGINKFLQEKEKEKIIKERKQKNKGWFSRPKELTPQQLQEIELYLNDNFSEDVKIIKRPAEYYYININFTLQKLEIIIANTMAIIKEGIQTEFVELELKFMLREGGYRVNLGLKDISIRLFKQFGADPKQVKDILYKIVHEKSVLTQEYLKMSVVGNPLDKTHLNTDIQLRTSELMIVFDPKIISIATDFADLKLSQENKEAAIEKYGEIKEKTSAAVNQSIDRPTKKQIGVNVLFSSITLAIPFSPKYPLRDCWGVNLGSVGFSSDEQTLKRTEIVDTLPLQVYNLNLQNFSFRHYRNIEELALHRRFEMKFENKTHAVIDDLDFKVQLQLYSRCTDKIPKLKVKATLPELQINMNSFIYENLLRIDKCFAKQEHHDDFRMSVIITQKTQIMNKASKVGIVHIKDSITQLWKKYVAVMSNNYIYIYLDKKDKMYTSYYYIKGASLESYKVPLDKEKPYHFKIKNKLNEVIFGFDKEDLIEDWKTKIKSLKSTDEIASSILEMSLSKGFLDFFTKKHNQLNLLVEATIEQTNINIFTTESQTDKVIQLRINQITTEIYLHESKKRIHLNLGTLQLKDSIQVYKNQQIAYFLYTSKQVLSENLININIEQYDKDHPDYKKIDSKIDVQFGTLNCNYKCETVKSLLKFFVKEDEQKYNVDSHGDLDMSHQQSVYFGSDADEQVFTLQLNLQISEISLFLINEKIKTTMGKMTMSNMNLFNGMSQKRMILKGSLGKLYYKDYTNYPYTIIQEQQSYGSGRYLLTAQTQEGQNMVDFDIIMLKKLNEKKKSLIVDVHLASLTVYYTQQQVLRIITYLNTQMLPSFESGDQKKKIKPADDVKPDLSTMDLKVDLSNICVYVEPEPYKAEADKEYLMLNIERITVRNSSIYRSYVTSLEPVILVENYDVKLFGMSISMKFVDPDGENHNYKLTNNMDFFCSTDLIANPNYYIKQYGQQFQNGLRVQCQMTPFFMRINHDDYSFIMKCLNWSITHNDGAETTLFDIPELINKIPDKNQSSQRFYLLIKMDCISLFLTRNNVPISFLLLDNMTYFFESGTQTQMKLIIDNLYGTAIEFNKAQNLIIEKGMFNALGYSKTYPEQDFKNIDKLISKFDRRSSIEYNAKPNPFLVFKMVTTATKSLLDIDIDELIIDVDIQLLLILSNLANTDQNYIKGPKPVVALPVIEEKRKDLIDPSEIKVQVVRKPVPEKHSTFSLKMNKLIGSISDRKKEKFMMIEGEINFILTSSGDKTYRQLQQIFSDEQKPEKVNNSATTINLTGFTMYFCNFDKGLIKRKREILKPMAISCEIIKFYQPHGELMVFATEIYLNTEQLLLGVSLKDINNINLIVQDSLAILDEVQANNKLNSIESNEKQLVQIEQKMQKAIQTSMKMKGKIKPIQFELVNDCNNNFMPVLRFLMAYTQPYMHRYLIKTHFLIVPVITLLFFNPRSSKWQPIIEAFKASVDYLVLVTKEGPTMKFLVETTNEQVGSLKINVSTQMIATLLAAKQVALVDKKNISNNIQAEQIQISPYIFHNITNETLYLERSDSQFQIMPLFQGPIRITSEDQLSFRLGKHKHVFKLDHYGILKIPESNYFIQYDSEKLNRVIRFLPNLMLKNCMQGPIYIKREGNVKQPIRKVEIGQLIPLDGIQTFAVSLNGSSYTDNTNVKNVKLIDYLLSQNKKFIVILGHKQKINKYEVIQILPPLIIHNLLPKNISLQLIANLKTLVTKSISAHNSHEMCASENIKNLQFKLLIGGYTWTRRFGFKSQQSQDEHVLEIEDQDNAKTTINYQFTQDKNNNQFKLLFYCKRVIVNELKDKLIVHGNILAEEKHKKYCRYELMGGQKKSDSKFDDKIILVGEETGNKIRVCGVNSMIDFARPITIGGLGSSQCRIAVDREINGKMESVFSVLGVQIELMKISKDFDIFCKKIVLRNRSIIINNTQNDLLIRENISQNFKFHIAAGAKQGFVFSMPDILSKNQHGIFIETQRLASKLLNVPEQGTTFFKLFSKTEKDMKGKNLFVYNKIGVKHVNNYVVYSIDEVKEEDLPYEIIIKSSNLNVNFSQDGKTYQKGQICRFINENSTIDEHQLILDIGYRDSPDRLILKAYPDDLNFRKKELVSIQKENMIGSVAIQVYVTFNDRKKIINIDQVHGAVQTKEREKNYLLFNITQIVLSVNQNMQYVDIPYESFVMTLRRICFIKNESDKKTQYQLKLGFLQLDQAYPHTLSNPVIITPYKFEQFTKEDKPKSIFNSIIVINNEFKENTFIHQIAVDFNDLVVKFTADFINIVTSISKQFAEVVNFKEEDFCIVTQVQEWRKMPIPKQGNKTFIKSIRIAPFAIELSAELKINKLNLQNNQFLSTILSAIGVVVSNIDGAVISMNGIQLSDCIDTVDNLTGELIKRYKSDCMSQLYKVFGSLNIIGNPMGLFKNITTGFKDLHEKPAQGFVNGPAEFGIGIAEGTRSLIAHSVGGAFSSISGITGTVSTGLATLAFDKDFEEHREKEKMKKPQNIIQGLTKGGKAIFYGFKEGITGVFLQPYQNAREQGALGFVKGTAKGLAGLVVKPVTGIIDFASKTTQGFKYQALKFQDKPNEQRMRHPRVFYSECFILKEYCLIDSQLQSVLKKVANEQKFNRSIYLQSFPAQNGKQYLTILQSHIVYIDVQRRKIHWTMPVEQILIAEFKNHNSLEFKGKKNSILRSNIESVVIESQDTRAKIINLVLNLQKEKTENL